MTSPNRLGPVLAAALGATLLLAVQTWADDSSDSLRLAVERAVAKVKPALVRIHVVSTSYREGREYKYEVSGSGIIITKEGHVVTNHHVAGHAARLVCTLANKEEIEAELVGTDPLTDIAVIKLTPREAQEFPVAAFGDSSIVKVGDPVMAMGSPRALSQSVTLGIISNNEMVLPKRMGFRRLELDGENVGSLVRWLAHDAEIHPGNSGGPLVNLAGEIIGINEISFGLAGAIPGNLVEGVARELIEHGSVKRSWIGIGIRPLLKHGGVDRGALVTSVIEGSPAAKAGFEREDILVRLAGEDITVRFSEELPALNRLVAGLPIGEEVEAVVLRKGKETRIALTTTERELARPKERELKQWGLTVRNISFIMSKEMKRSTQDGVVITSVRPGGPAGESKPALARGDVIVRVGNTPVASVDDLVRFTRELTEKASEPVPVVTAFERKAGHYVTVANVGITEPNDPGLEVKKAWLPVETQVITRDIAEGIGQPDLTGFRLTQVYAHSSAETAGLEVGDFVVAVDGEKLTASALEHYEELPTLIRNYRVGTVAELTVQRDGEERTVPVELVRAPKLDREMRKYRDENFEFTVRDITFFDRANKRWEEEQRGVLVDVVKSGGWAALGMLRVGDLIFEVDGRPIVDVDSLEEVMADVADARPPAVVIEVLRGIYTQYIELEPKWENR